ncbi:hypothetical protein FK178_09150 [Antarcticibacterium arcticum]|uniref:Uncharacterized protein n=1 Tax=Antarcticibacterium arcticum TaxID=2585771 RepID=A0A5B8YIW1_9FLAO|nr:hypothetical protein [Antarcticibacterium arcticum]QED37880.1 hypothetical protein FK178_09150 [Antarcticibacterium arcticum]
MGQHRVEKQFKDKLGQREIKPVDNSWNKLKFKLDKEEKSRQPVFWWIGIAASLLGGLLIAGLVYFTGPDESPVIVGTPYEAAPETNASEELILPVAGNKNNSPEIKAEVIAAEEEKNNASAAPDIRKTFIAAENIGDQQKEKELAQGSIPEYKEEAILAQKLEEILAETELSETEDGISLEIEALLRNAANEISQDKQNAGISSRVDARELLYDVEMELEQSFREKVFDVLKEGYLKAKTAVANRNLQ